MFSENKILGIKNPKEKAMKKETGWMLVITILMLVAATPAYASLAQSTSTMVEGAVEFPMGLVKFVGGVIWTVGEVIVFPFRAIF